jgi:hypothetical protein
LLRGGGGELDDVEMLQVRVFLLYWEI